ncbi:enoyl-CoA hydratase/isomerase family protein [Paralcaligenes sp. KSB-10]|uniref:enoyl-CoA hydratase/isomerase family protein n=1 Tax=Paralcaligenes sp. KSB-10 TaxID=2901142 RepID=UPI001E3D99E9|nr:enoyl-CoA hydratase/isomerase family protein [Paralcaligenes sp. KSB-10]UHL64215.1 enoyl-CoA hydratase/isomerase family protein [Paralcaligenes sp. KSB-10]
MTTISTTLANGVGTIFLDRPKKRNALNRPMCVDLRRAVRDMDASSDVRLILLRAKGPVFCAGADIDERATLDDDGVRARRLLAFAAYSTIESVGKPCVAVVEGPAIGSGAEIATACDFIVATEHARFKFPEAAMGTIGATQRLPAIVGRWHAKELLFTGREIDAHEGRLIGLVSRLISADMLSSELTVLCNAIMSAPPSALAAAKRCVDAAADQDRRAALASELLSIESMLIDENWEDRMRP